MTNHDRSHWLRLSLIPSLSDRCFRQLLQSHGSVGRVSQLCVQQLRGSGLKENEASDVYAAFNKPSYPLDEAVDKALAWSAEPAQNIVTLADVDYPPLLKEIPDPPPLLYVRGRREALLLPQVALVGSRASSVDGQRNASLFGSQLAKAGLSVISGLAMGIDTFAHAAALQAGGNSVAIMGTGADTIYPRGNRALAERLLESGALVTELALGSPPKSEHFPRRNRIISGMSLALVVVEAALRSGSLISARLAMEQGREVFAVPGSIRNTKTRGCHQLIRDGAQLLENVDQIFEAIEPMVRCHVQTLDEQLSAPDLTSPARATLTQEERAVLKTIGYDPVSVDSIVASTGINVAKLQTLLVSLELKAAIICRAGTYVLV